MSNDKNKPETNDPQGNTGSTTGNSSQVKPLSYGTENVQRDLKPESYGTRQLVSGRSYNNTVDPPNE